MRRPHQRRARCSSTGRYRHFRCGAQVRGRAQERPASLTNALVLPGSYCDMCAPSVPKYALPKFAREIGASQLTLEIKVDADIGCQDCPLLGDRTGYSEECCVAPKRDVGTSLSRLRL